MDQRATYLSFAGAFYEALLWDSPVLAWCLRNDGAIRTWQRTRYNQALICLVQGLNELIEELICKAGEEVSLTPVFSSVTLGGSLI